MPLPKLRFSHVEPREVDEVARLVDECRARENENGHLGKAVVLLKARVKGYYRQLPDGQSVWVREHKDERTARQRRRMADQSGQGTLDFVATQPRLVVLSKPRDLTEVAPEPTSAQLKASYASKENSKLARAIFPLLTHGTYDRVMAHRWALRLMTIQPTSGKEAISGVANFSYMLPGAFAEYDRDARVKVRYDKVFEIYHDWQQRQISPNDTKTQSQPEQFQQPTRSTQQSFSYTPQPVPGEQHRMVITDEHYKSARG